MSDTNNKNSEIKKQNETPKKHSFFWWEINSKTKDLLDFRYNTQEEIDKLNEEMTTTDDLDDIMKKTNQDNLENQKEKDTENEYEEAESDLELNLQWADNSPLENAENYNYDEIYNKEESKPIEWEIVENPDNGDNQEYNSEWDDEKNNIRDDYNNDWDNNLDENKESDIEKIDENKEEDNQEVIKNDNKFFDPFELNFDNEDEGNNTNEDIFEENNEITEDVMKNNEDEVENTEDEVEDTEDDVENAEDDVEDTEDDVEDTEDDVEDTEDDVEDTEDDVENTEDDVENTEDDVEDTNRFNNSNKKNEENENKNPKDKKNKKYSATWQEITDDEIQLEQWQDTPNSEDEEEYQPSAEELFEREPEFFANDEISQQFMRLVQNTRWIFKLERRNWEECPYFKILWWKTSDSTIEYLFYLIEEEDEPIDLYIKKIETDNDEENEHLVQFSYNEDKELNIFVDEVILYEKVNKSDSNTTEHNDTKAILEKFIFLTDTYYNELQTKYDEERKEKQKKKQLQQIFKGF